MTNRLLISGAFGALAFVGVLLLEGATRPGYDAWLRYGSELSLSDQGWMQIANFMICGLLIVLGAAGLWQALPGARIGVILIGLFGFGLVLAGTFTMDPRAGYPIADASASAKTRSGIVHGLAGLLCFSTVAAAAIVFAREFKGTAWAPYSMLTGLTVAASFVAATLSSVIADTGTMSDAPTGLLQRVGIVAGWTWAGLVMLHVWGERSGRPLVISARALLVGGIVGPLLFVTVFLVEGATRPGYDPMRSMVSELSLSESGWQQIVNFLIAGTLIFGFSAGLRRTMAARPGGTWGPRLLGITGLGLIVAGVFVCDPGLAYPGGAPDGLPVSGSWQNSMHGVGGVMVFFSLPAACFVLARSFSRTPWATYSVLTGLVGLSFFMASNVNAMHGGPAAGLFQRLAIGAYFAWLMLLAWRLRRASNDLAGHQPYGDGSVHQVIERASLVSVPAVTAAGHSSSTPPLMHKPSYRSSRRCTRARRAEGAADQAAMTLQTVVGHTVGALNGVAVSD
jgi:hypothetical membrane protein